MIQPVGIPSIQKFHTNSLCTREKNLYIFPTTFWHVMHTLLLKMCGEEYCQLFKWNIKIARCVINFEKLDAFGLLFSSFIRSSVCLCVVRSHFCTLWSPICDAKHSSSFFFPKTTTYVQRHSHPYMFTQSLGYLLFLLLLWWMRRWRMN